MGQDGAYRVFGRYFNIANSAFPDGREAADGWQGGHAGFRSDWNLSASNALTVQGDFFKTDEGETITTLFSNALPLAETLNDSVNTTAGNILARWNHTLANGSVMSLQVYYDYARRFAQGFPDSEKTLDLDFQHHVALGSRNDVVWGLGSRFIASNYGVGDSLTILPNHRFDRLYSAFLQDQLKLANSLSLTVGSKFEHNDFTGFEFEPSVQLVWTPTETQTLWVSAARAIREPSTLEDGLQDDAQSVRIGSSFAVVRVLGNPNIKSEELRDVEAGYRALANKRLSLDITAFGSLYRNLQYVTALAPFVDSQQGASYLVLPEEFANGPQAHTYGAEFFANWS
jgi:iron complex outermembrane receptor protein